MKKTILALVFLAFASPAFAWNCSDPLASRVPVVSGTSGSFGNGDGQLFLGTGSEGTKGQLYQCQVPKPPVTPPTPPTVNQSQNQTQNSSANSNATSNSSANSKSTSSVTGGNSTSTSTGGSATATGGSSVVKNSGNSILTNSGNSSNTNNTTANGGTGGSASSSNNSAGNVTSFVDNQVRQTPMAYAPDAAFTTSPCVKGFSGGVSLPGGAGSLGVSKTDKGCDSRQTAVVFYALGNKTAAARILCSSDAARRAKLTLDDCLAIVVPPVPQIVVPQPPAAPQPQVIVVPAPQPVLAPIAAQPSPDCNQPKAVPVHYTRVCKASTKIATIGFCKLHNSIPDPGCYVILDEAVGAIGVNNNARIVLTGPVESGRVVLYLKQHKISLNQITLKLADDQNGTLTVQTEIGE
jgi:hypothetical protein